MFAQSQNYRSRQVGFTLLEVIVSMAIFVVSLGSLYLIFETSVDRANQSAVRSEAVAIAQSVLSESLAKGGNEDDSGTINSFQWNIAYKPSSEMPERRSRWLLYTVETSVTWERKSKVESVTFVTKRIGPTENR